MWTDNYKFIFGFLTNHFLLLILDFGIYILMHYSAYIRSRLVCDNQRV